MCVCEAPHTKHHCLFEMCVYVLECQPKLLTCMWVCVGVTECVCVCVFVSVCVPVFIYGIL